jgi:hypothetical protein
MNEVTSSRGETEEGAPPAPSAPSVVALTTKSAEPLGFVPSVALVVLCLIGARLTLDTVGITGYRMFTESTIWWHVGIYFCTAGAYYATAVGIIRFVQRLIVRRAPQSN